MEVRFEPELDELFGVTHTKQHVRITVGSPLFNQMEAAIKANVNTLLDMIEHRKPKRAECAEPSRRGSKTSGESPEACGGRHRQTHRRGKARGGGVRRRTRRRGHATRDCGALGSASFLSSRSSSNWSN